MKLYGSPVSGNTHRVQAILGVLGIAHDYHIVNLKEGEHKSPEYLKLNPLGQVPVFVDGDVVLRDSTAIMTYIARKFDKTNTWLPTDPLAQARVQEWLSTAVNEIQAGPFVVRLVKLLGVPLDYDGAKAKTETLLGDLMEPHLTGRAWLAGEGATLADLACYSYIARVTEGDVSLAPYPAVRAWLARCESIEGFPPMATAAELFG